MSENLTLQLEFISRPGPHGDKGISDRGSCHVFRMLPEKRLQVLSDPEFLNGSGVPLLPSLPLGLDWAGDISVLGPF